MNAPDRSPERPLVSGRYVNWRIAGYYVLTFVGGGAVKPFINLYLSEVGLTGTQIGAIQGWTALLTVAVTPLLGVLVDRTQRYRAFLALFVAGKGVLAALLPLSGAWLWQLSLVSLRVTVAGAHSALMNRLTLARVHAYGRRDVGPWFLMGSVFFASASILAGLLARERSIAVLFPLAGVLGVAAIPFVSAFPARVAARAQASRPAPARRSLQLLFLFAVVALFTAGLSGAETFASLYLAVELGAGNDLIGLLTGTNWLAGLLAYWAAGRLIGRLGAARTLAASLGCYLLAWCGYAAIARPALALPLSALEGFGQATYTIALIVLLGELALPERAATDQMLVQMTVPGLARMAAQPLSGWAFDRLGGRALLAMDAAIVLVAAGALLARATWIANQGKRPGIST